MEERLPREEILRRLDWEHQRLMDTFARLTPEQWVTTGAVGTWSAKDVLAHLVYWVRYPAQELEAAVSGSSLMETEGSDDDINARSVASFKDATPEAVRSAFEHAYNELIDFVRTLPTSAFEAGSPIEQALDETIHGALANNTYEHWPIHEAQIRSWIEA